MKKIIGILLTAVFLTMGLNSMSEASSTTSLVIDNQKVDLDYPILTENNYTLLPLRFFSEKLGAEVEYQADNKMALISKNEKAIKLLTDGSKAYVNNNEEKLNGPIKNLNGKLYVPLRFLAESLGVNIDWNNTTREISVTTDQKPNNEQDNNADQDNSSAQDRILWQKQLNKPITAEPYISEEQIAFVPNGHNLTAIDKDGNELWTKSIGYFDIAGNKEQKLGTPLQIGNLLYVSGADYQKNTSNFVRSLYCVNKDGKVVWTVNQQSEYQGKYGDIPGSLSYSEKDKQLYTRTKQSAYAYLLQPYLRWTYSSEYEIPLDPIVVNRNEQAHDVVVVDRDTQGKIYVLNSDGEEEWQYPIQVGRVTAMLYDHQSRCLYIALDNVYSTGGGTGVICLDLLTKEWKWQKTVDDQKINQMRILNGTLYVATDKHFYTISNNGNIKKYDDSYNETKDFSIDENGNVLTLSSDGTIRKIVDNGVVWETKVLGAEKLLLKDDESCYVVKNDNLIFIDTK